METNPNFFSNFGHLMNIFTDLNFISFYLLKMLILTLQHNLILYVTYVQFIL